MKIILFGIALLLAGCSKSKAECRKQADDLGTTLRGMDRSSGVETRHVKPVLRTDLPVTDEVGGWVIELSAEGAQVAGLVEKADSAEAALAAILRVGRGDPSETLGRLQIAIDGSTPWIRVAELLRALDAVSARQVTFVFARPPSTQQPPARSSIDPELDAITSDTDPSNKAMKVAQLASKLVAECPEVSALFDSVSETGRKEDTLIAGLPPALIACNCKCDVPALKSLMWRLLANQHPTTTLTLTFGGTGPALGFPSVTPWSEASLQIKPGVRLRR
jgi:hypothetical protein